MVYGTYAVLSTPPAYESGPKPALLPSALTFPSLPKPCEAPSKAYRRDLGQRQASYGHVNSRHLGLCLPEPALMHQLIRNSLRVATMTIVICGQVVAAMRPGLIRKLDEICSRGD